MFANSYYALVAGFREYTLDGEMKGFDIEAILSDVFEVLSSKDKKSVELLYAYYDCENLISRHNGSSTYNALGRLSSEEVDEALRQPSCLIAPLAKVVRDYASLNEEDDAEEVDLSQPFAQALASSLASAACFMTWWAKK